MYKISRAHFHQDILVIETTISGFLSDKSRRYILNKAKSITALQFNQLMCLLMLLSHGIFYIFFLTYYFSFGEIIKAGHFKKPHYCRHLSHLMRKPTICICENKGADVTAKLISAFLFAIQIVQYLLYLTPKFQASSLLL